jgi:hypothetical protein
MTIVSAAELRAQAAQAKRVAAELEQQAALATRAEADALKPKMPAADVDTHPVVTFSRYQSGREYNYAAIGFRIGRQVRWAVTGKETRRFNWPGLLAFIGEANWATLELVCASGSLLPEGAEPAVAERMARFGKVVSSEVLEDPPARGRFAEGGYVPAERTDGPNPGWGSQRGGY